jgi:cytochrome subunit of sulfide dehydrogenase
MKSHVVAVLALVSAAIFPALAQAQTPGRLLASNCFQCHGTNGNGGFERLTEDSAAELFEELKELQGNPATAEHEEEIMVVHANGFTDAELWLIAKFFASK